MSSAGVVAAGGGTQNEVTLIQTNGRTAVSQDVNYPSADTILAGDLILFHQSVPFNGGSPVTPTGFTSIITNSNAGGQGIQTRLSYKIASGGESGLIPYTSVGTHDSLVCAIYRGAHDTTPIENSNSNAGYGTSISNGDVTSAYVGTTVGFASIVKDVSDSNGFSSYPSPAYTVQGISYTPSLGSSSSLCWHFMDTVNSRPAGTYGSWSVVSPTSGDWTGIQIFVRAAP